MSKQPIYVVDTNILVDYPNIIPTTNPDDQSKNPTIDLNGAHLVIPTAVIRELSKFKEEYTSRGKSARMVLSKIRELIETGGGKLPKKAKNPKRLRRIKKLLVQRVTIGFFMS